MTHEEFDQIYDESGCDGNRDKLIAYLFDQRKQLQAWKDSMMALEREWDQQRIAKLLGGQLGKSCRKIINERVPALVALTDEMEELLVDIGNTIRERTDGHTVVYSDRLRPFLGRIDAVLRKAGWEVTP